MKEAEGVPKKIKQREEDLKRVRGELSIMMTTLRTTDHTEIPQTIYDEIGRLEKELRYIESELNRLRHLRDHVNPNADEIRFITERLKELPSALQNTDTYQIHQFLRSAVSRIELEGKEVRDVFLVNTPKTSMLLQNHAPKTTKGQRSSLQPPSTSSILIKDALILFNILIDMCLQAFTDVGELDSYAGGDISI